MVDNDFLNDALDAAAKAIIDAASAARSRTVAASGVSAAAGSGADATMVSSLEAVNLTAVEVDALPSSFAAVREGGDAPVEMGAGASALSDCASDSDDSEREDGRAHADAVARDAHLDYVTLGTMSYNATTNVLGAACEPVFRFCPDARDRLTRRASAPAHASDDSARGIAPEVILLHRTCVLRFGDLHVCRHRCLRAFVGCISLLLLVCFAWLGCLWQPVTLWPMDIIDT